MADASWPASARTEPSSARSASAKTGYVAIYAIGASAVLILLGDEGLDITRLHRESRSVVDSEKLLA